jgi:hypothetical protein
MRPVFFAAATLMVSACMIDEPDEGTVDQHAESWNRLASNRLASNRLASNRLASNRLASNRLASNRLEANPDTDEILETPEGRDVYSYIISCALTEDVTIEAQVPGAPNSAPPATPYTCNNGTCTFQGALGVAPRWETHRLSKPGERWVSACLFSRVNANDTAEAISLRGNNDGLIVSQEEMELYTAEEGAFYGNLFIDDPDPDAEPDWNACRGRAKAECPGDVGCGGLGNRDCALEDPMTPGKTYCGFKYAGDCGDFTGMTKKQDIACWTYDVEAGVYSRCRPQTKQLDWANLHNWDWKDWRDWWRSKRRFREVITTWVANN